MNFKILFSKQGIGWFLLLTALLLFETFKKTNKDFDIFIDASRFLLEGKSCYDKSNPAGLGYQFYYYSPLFALLIAPLTSLPTYAVYLIWTLLNYFFMYRIIRCIQYFLPLSGFDKKKQSIFFILCLASTIRFLLYNLDLGQLTIFLVYASLESIRLILQNQIWRGAALLALAINFKILPLALIPYLFYRGEFKATLYTFILLFGTLFIPALFFGFEFNLYQHQEWWALLNDNVQNSLSYDSGRQSLTSFIPSLLMETTGEFTYRRHIANLEMTQIKLILNSIRVALVITTLYFLHGGIFKKQTQAILHFAPLAFILLITPLIAPHQGKYSYFYSLPAYVFCIYILMHHATDMNPWKYRSIIFSLALSFILMTLSTDGVVGRHWRDIGEHYHVITVGACVLIFPMLLCYQIIRKHTF